MCLFCCKVTITGNTVIEKLSQVMATEVLDKAALKAGVGEIVLVPKIKQYCTESADFPGTLSSSRPGMKARPPPP